MAKKDELNSEVTIIVSAEMLKQFSILTGDFSSLHVDSDFARTSAFRTNVVHGMLPVLFVLCPSMCWKPGKKARINKISGTFLKPVFLEDELRVIIEDAQAGQETAIFEFKIVHVGSNAVVTMGKIELFYDKASIFHGGDSKPTADQSLLLTQLKEKENTSLDKGTGDAFLFSLNPNVRTTLANIIHGGLINQDRLLIDEWLKHCDLADLLAVSLCSTFAGMCIPGKKATFIDFQAEFSDPLPWGEKYRFAGEIKFHSPSTDILVEKWQVTAEGADCQIYAKGEIKTKINEPRRVMPSIAQLKEHSMSLQLENKVALITGASRGIGETTAKLLSLFGVTVVINYNRSQEDAVRIVQEIERSGGKALALQADVAHRRQVETMVKTAAEKFGRIDILVNNAVRDARPMSFLETTWEEVQKDIDVTVKGAFHCCQEVVPIMIKNKGGKIINLSTIFAENPPANQAKYVISKNALVGLTRSLAVELGPNNIQVNMVVPSVTLTDLSNHVPKFFMERMKNDSPMKRHACPEEVAQAIVFLASSFSSFTTGQKIMVTGGQAPLL